MRHVAGGQFPITCRQADDATSCASTDARALLLRDDRRSRSSSSRRHGSPGQAIIEQAFYAGIGRSMTLYGRAAAQDCTNGSSAMDCRAADFDSASDSARAREDEGNAAAGRIAGDGGLSHLSAPGVRCGVPHGDPPARLQAVKLPKTSSTRQLPRRRRGRRT